MLKKTLMKVVRIDVKKYNISNDLAENISKWKTKLRVVEPKLAGTRL